MSIQDMRVLCGVFSAWVDCRTKLSTIYYLLFTIYFLLFPVCYSLYDNDLRSFALVCLGLPWFALVEWIVPFRLKLATSVLLAAYWQAGCGCVLIASHVKLMSKFCFL